MMANLSNTNVLPNIVAKIYNKLESIILKLNNTSASIAFINKTLFVDVIRKLTLVKVQFINETDSLIASRKLIKIHLTKHIQDFTIYEYNIMIR